MGVEWVESPCSFPPCSSLSLCTQSLECRGMGSGPSTPVICCRVVLGVGGQTQIGLRLAGSFGCLDPLRLRARSYLHLALAQEV